MSKHEPSPTSWTQTISTANPMYRTVSCSTQEANVPERGQAIGEMCPLYAAPKPSNQMVSLDAIYQFQRNHFGHAKSKYITSFTPKDRDCNFSIAGALFILSFLGILLSGTVILLWILLSRGVITLASRPITTTDNDLSCYCEGPSNPEILLNLEQELDNIQHQINLLQAKIRVSKSEAEEQADQFELQTKAMNDAMEKKLSSHLSPMVEVSGLDYPAWVTLDGINNGCIHKMDSEDFQESIDYTSIAQHPYMNGTHIAVDIVCMLLFDGKPIKGSATAVVQYGKSPSLGSSLLKCLPTASIYCECFILEKITNKKTLECRRELLLCPYTIQSLDIFVKKA